MLSQDVLFSRLKKSAFRSRFQLKEKEKAYINEKGLIVIRSHTQDFISKRLAPVQPINEGKQTPMRVIRYLLPSMRQRHAAGGACLNGMESQPAESLRFRSRHI